MASGYPRGRIALPLLVTAANVARGDDDRRTDVLGAMAVRAGATLLATGDVRYHVAGRRRPADVLSAIRLRTTADRLGFHAKWNGERMMRSPAEMARLFKRHPEAIANSVRVLDGIHDLPLFAIAREGPEAAMEAYSPLVDEAEAVLPRQVEGMGVVADDNSFGMTLRSHPLALICG